MQTSITMPSSTTTSASPEKEKDIILNDILPNPTTDLHWSHFLGAIQDIFSHNASTHPSRICVTETTSPTAAERVFTYQQISEAANVLSHHLIEKGVGR